VWTLALFFYSVTALLFGAYLQITSSGARHKFSMAFGFGWPIFVLREFLRYIVFRINNVRSKLMIRRSDRNDIARDIELSRVAAQVTRWEREAAELRRAADSSVSESMIEMARWELQLAWALELLAHLARFEYSLPPAEDSPVRVRCSASAARVELPDRDLYTTMVDDLNAASSEAEVYREMLRVLNEK